jgi:hypothetical protein
MSSRLPIDLTTIVIDVDDDGPDKVSSSSSKSSSIVSATAPTATVAVPTTDETNTTAKSDIGRRSGRVRNSTVTYIDGHAVLKSNNYVVKGSTYRFALEDRAAATPHKGKGGGSGGVKRGRRDCDRGVDTTATTIATTSTTVSGDDSIQKKTKTNNHHSSLTKQYNPSIQEIQRKDHNDRIKASKESKQVLRQAFLSGHADVLKPFVDNSIYQNLVEKQNCTSDDDRNHTTSSSNPSTTISQPKLITGGTLRDYQLDGLKFMVGHHRRNLGIILGDEMGTF